MPNQEKKPYVRYAVSADIVDKGVAFTVKKAIAAFLNSRGIEFRFTDFQKSSDSFDAVLEIYDNGQQDFNIQNLLGHIKTSGKLPNIERKRPDVKIEPIPCDYAPEIMPQSEHRGCLKTIEGLNTRLNEQEGTIRDLTKSLDQRQRVIDEQTRKTSLLEKQLRETPPSHHDSPVLAVVHGYLTQFVEVLADISGDFEAVQNDWGFFIERSKNPSMGFVHYVNAKHSTTFEKEEEIDRLVQEVKGAPDWESSQDGKRLTSQKTQYQVDREMLELAKEKGASAEILSALEKVVSETEEKAKAVEKGMAASRTQFEKGKALCQDIENLRISYEKLVEIGERAALRRKKNTKLPILLHEERQSLRIYIPSFEPESLFEKFVRQGFDKDASFSSAYSVSYSSKDDISILEITQKNHGTEVKQENPFEEVRNYAKAILGDAVLNAIGVSLEITSLSQ